jgi:uncharacterized protein YjiS (DUF1127 family)
MLENKSVSPSLFFQGEQQAQINRSLDIKACMSRTMRTFAEWLRVLASRSIVLVRDLAARRVVSRAIRELHQLDDRTLADIGVTRGEIESAVARRTSLLSTGIH